MKPHIWFRRGRWGCGEKGDVFYGKTPEEAYIRWFLLRSRL